MAETAPATSCGTRGRSDVYRRRRPERTVLHRLVRAHLETYLARSEEADPLGDGVPDFVEAQFRAYLQCGILAHGFARARCSGCGHDFLVAFSCKGRGICPSCNSRRMAATAAHLTDHVIPAVPVRQWVLSVPKRLRYFLHRDPKAAGAVLHILLRALRRTLRDCSPGAGSDAKFGAVSFLHRFGASLNPHFHYHLCVLDGLYEAAEEGEGENSPSGSVRFHEATALTRADVEALQETIRRRVLRWFRRRGLLEEHTVREMLGWDHAGGFSLDASVRIAAHDRAGLERVLRYCARPPFALNRIEWQDSGGGDGEGVVLYRLSRATPDGRTVVRLSPHLVPLGGAAGPDPPRAAAGLPRLRRGHAADRLPHRPVLHPGRAGPPGRTRPAAPAPSGPGTARARARLRGALGRRDGPEARRRPLPTRADPSLRDGPDPLLVT